MPQAAATPTTSRRLLALAGAASFATGSAASAAMPDDRDGALLRLLTRFDELEHHIIALRAIGADDILVEAAMGPEIAAAEAEQDSLCEAIRDARAVTVPGILARARSIALWAPDNLRQEYCRGWDERFIAALLRDLVAMRG